ncbi:hypothetical protein Tco_0272221 [Tanacetum coccineum]
MHELHDATVVLEDANMKFLRKPSIWWHLVVSNSNSQTALLYCPQKSRVQYFETNTCRNTKIPKGYTQAILEPRPTRSQLSFSTDEIICSFFSQQHLMPTTHDDEDLTAGLDEDVMEEIDIRWQWL